MLRKVTGAALALWLSVLPLQAAQAAMEITAGWTRQTVPGATAAVGYFVVKNTGARKRELLKITSPLSSGITLHQSSVDAQGVSRMWPIGKLEVEPGQTVTFAPNGKHLMLAGLTQPLRVGQRVAVTLVFQDEAPVTVELTVRPLVEEAAPSMDHLHHDHP
jgi:copper(I)-binding protein